MKLYTSKAVAGFLDLTERRVRQLRDEGVIQEKQFGLYDLLDTNKRYINYLRKKNPDSGENIDYNTERAKLSRAKRINEEFDLKIKKGQLHASGEIEQIMSDMFINFKARLMSIPAKLSPILAKKSKQAEIYSILKSNIDEALIELSDYNAAFGIKEESEDE